ncbi:hypothetical protein ACE1X4_22405, partial [Bacillus subtilis]|uniref:hypothetical protein n=1 Tax=Bacillus subtilis TaxID=1423 RepID=UPI0035BEE4E5
MNQAMNFPVFADYTGADRKWPNGIDPRKEIFFDPDRMDAVVDESEAALASCGEPIFSRGGSLVRLVEDEVDGTKGRKVKALRFKDLDRAFTVERLSRCARFY